MSDTTAVMINGPVLTALDIQDGRANNLGANFNHIRGGLWQIVGHHIGEAKRAVTHIHNLNAAIDIAYNSDLLNTNHRYSKWYISRMVGRLSEKEVEKIAL